MIVKSMFLTELVLKDGKEDEQMWVLMENLDYASKLFQDIIRAPKGFVTDLASTGLLRKRCHRESVIHDYCYQTHIVSKDMADRIFLEAMKSRNKPFYVRWTYYLAVKMFGGKAYQTGKERYQILNV